MGTQPPPPPGAPAAAAALRPLTPRDRTRTEFIYLLNELRLSPFSIAKDVLKPLLVQYTTWEGSEVLERADGRKVGVSEGRACCEETIEVLKTGGMNLWKFEVDEELSAIALARAQTFVDDPASHRHGASDALASLIEAKGEWSGAVAVRPDRSRTDAYAPEIGGASSVKVHPAANRIEPPPDPHATAAAPPPPPRTPDATFGTAISV